MMCDMVGSRGGDTGSDPPPPWKNHKHIGFLSNIGPDPWKSQSYQAIIGPQAKRHLNGVSLVVR